MKTQFNLSQYPLWTALVTPFNAHGQVDYDNLKHLVATQAEANNAILILGSTGEGLALDVLEQQRIVEFVCNLAPEVPIMVAVGGFNLAEQVRWVEFCNTQPVDALLLGSPLYAKPGSKGLTQWFDSLLSATNLPCMIYNVPGRSAVSIAPEVLTNLADHDNLWALKEASGDISHFEQFRKALPRLAIFSGDDALMPYFAQAGAVGLVSVAANAWPEQTATFVKRALSGNHPNLFSAWRDAIDALFSVANPIPVKALMHHQGTLNTPHLRPPLTHLELDSIATLDQVNQQILSWD